MTRLQAEKALEQIEAKIGQLEEKDTLSDFNEELLSLLEDAQSSVSAVLDHYETR